MGAVAMNTKSLERRDISEHVSGRHPRLAGSRRRMEDHDFHLRAHGEFVDYLNPDSVDRFCSLTYDQYYKRFSEPLWLDDHDELL